jgi:hypothetical protein
MRRSLPLSRQADTLAAIAALALRQKILEVLVEKESWCRR